VGSTIECLDRFFAKTLCEVRPASRKSSLDCLDSVITRGRLIVEARLEEVDPIVRNTVDDPMFLREAARPDAGSQIFEGLRSAYSREWIPEDCFDKIKRPKRNPSVCLDPISQVFDELGLEDRIPGLVTCGVTLRQALVLGAALQLFEGVRSSRRLVLGREAIAQRSLANAVDALSPEGSIAHPQRSARPQASPVG
jgi:hypothetical protein